MQVKLHWAERFINFMVHHTDLYQRKTKENKHLEGIARDKYLFDQLVPFFEQLKKEAYLEGKKDGISEYAWWKDGEQYVGTCGTTLKKALEKIKL